MRHFICMLWAACAAAQTLPSYWVSAGGSYNYYASPKLAAGFVSFAAHLPGSTPVYAMTTVDLTPRMASVREEGAYVFSTQGKAVLFGLVGAGFAVGNGSAAGNFAGGGGVAWRFNDLLAVTAALRVVACTAGCTTAQPTAVQAVPTVGVLLTFGKQP